MRKEEFLEGLGRALSVTGSQALVDENIKYYASYIEEEKARGREEEEIVDELGDPRLLAHSIKDAAGFRENTAGEVKEQPEYVPPRYGDGQQSYTDDYGNEKRTNVKSFRLTGAGFLLLVAVFFALVFTIFFILFRVVEGVLDFLAPVLGPLVCVLIIFWFINMYRKK